MDSIAGKVYNITPYLDFHPGGIDELMRGAGTDGTALFDEVLTGLDKQKKFQRKIVNIFLPINFNICFGCSKEPSH